MPAIPEGTRRRPCPGSCAASSGPWWAAGRRRRCRRCGRSRAGGSGRGGRRPRTSPATRPPRSRSLGRSPGRAQLMNAPGNDRQPSSASSRLRSLPSGRVSSGLQTTPTVWSPESSGQSKTNTRRSTPTWQAARPTPSAAYMVATMSATRVRRSSSYAVTSACGRCITGVPQRVIGRTVPPSGSGPCGACDLVGAHARNPSEGSARGRPHGPPARVSGDTRTDPDAKCNSELQLAHVRPHQAIEHVRSLVPRRPRPAGLRGGSDEPAGPERASRPPRHPQAHRARRLHGHPRRLPYGDHRRPRLRQRRQAGQGRHPARRRAGPGASST